MTVIGFPGKTPDATWTKPKTLEDWPWDNELGKPHMDINGTIDVRVSSPPATENILLKGLAERYEICLNTAKAKNADYATDADPFANFTGCEKYGIPTAKGMLVRMEDKMRRIANLLDRPAIVTGESIQDSLMDLANYALILSVWLDSDKAS